MGVGIPGEVVSCEKLTVQGRKERWCCVPLKGPCVYVADR